MVRPGADGQAVLDRWLGDGFVSLTGAHFDAVPPGIPKKGIQEIVEHRYAHAEYPQRRALTDDYYAFLTLMSEDDVVLARHDDLAWVGRITGEPEFADETPRLRRSVEWLEQPTPITDLPSEATALPGSPRLVTDLTTIYGPLEALLEDEPTPQEAAVTLRPATSELATELNLSTEWLDDYISLLESRHQVIAYGPPGTGKTFVARKVARHVAGEDRMTVVQFHPSYAYEDFFEGLRPVTSDGAVTYEVMPGPLRTLAAAAEADPTHPYVLIIDEINRADIAKVFGELYYLLEYRGERITLQYSPDKPFSLPKNLYLIGTMNTADRSIAMVDAAIRRRFPFIEMHPSEKPVSDVLAKYLAATPGSNPELTDLLATLNAQLTGKHREFQIGPSYLMRPEAGAEEGLQRIWRYDILPLLEEQLYGTHTREQVHEQFGLAAIRREVTRHNSQLVANALPDDAEG
jgi:5-methylcytosine-specific restriction protein B